jgi:hypothetical protein
MHLSFTQQYEQLIDKNKNYQNLPVDLELKMFFGQLLYIVVIPIPQSRELQMTESKTLCLVVIQQVHLLSNSHPALLIPSYLQTGALDPIDIKFIQYIVSHVKDKGKWSLVDYSGPLVHAVFSKAD